VGTWLLVVAENSFYLRQKKEILSTRNLSQGEVSGDEERESRKGQGGLSKFIFLIFRFFLMKYVENRSSKLQAIFTFKIPA
jgi:hypothetical protein